MNSHSLKVYKLFKDGGIYVGFHLAQDCPNNPPDWDPSVRDRVCDGVLDDVVVGATVLGLWSVGTSSLSRWWLWDCGSSLQIQRRWVPVA